GVSGFAVSAVNEWVTVRDCGASPKLRVFAEECGFAGATDELLSFLHSQRFEELLEVADIDYYKALKALRAEKHPNCLCESCTHTEDADYSDIVLNKPYYSISRAVNNAERKRANLARQENRLRRKFPDAREKCKESILGHLQSTERVSSS
ncbi:MAG: hypothetical protein WC822_06535, partial [Candidatus Paceibacterota bacterium]